MASLILSVSLPLDTSDRFKFCPPPSISFSPNAARCAIGFSLRKTAMHFLRALCNAIWRWDCAIRACLERGGGGQARPYSSQKSEVRCCAFHPPLRRFVTDRWVGWLKILIAFMWPAGLEPDTCVRLFALVWTVCALSCSPIDHHHWSVEGINLVA